MEMGNYSIREHPEYEARIPHMIKLKEAEALSRLPYYQLRKLFLAGKIAGVRLAGVIYLNEDSLIEYLSSHMNSEVKND